MAPLHFPCCTLTNRGARPWGTGAGPGGGGAAAAAGGGGPPARRRPGARRRHQRPGALSPLTGDGDGQGCGLSEAGWGGPGPWPRPHMQLGCQGWHGKAWLVIPQVRANKCCQVHFFNRFPKVDLVLQSRRPKHPANLVH